MVWILIGAGVVVILALETVLFAPDKLPKKRRRKNDQR